MRKKIRKKNASKRSRLDDLKTVADEFEGWGPGREILTPVRSLPTIFPQFNVATRVNGYPLQRVCMIHGPSNHGKTVFMMGLGRSFLELGHFYFHVDAEMTTPEEWVSENLGEYANSPMFRASRPRHYEEIAGNVRKACETLTKMRSEGRIGQDVSALFGIDSLQKLVPKDYFEQLAKEGGLDPKKGRGGMLLAALNSAWMRELIPLMYHSNAALLLVSRESENTERTSKYEVGYKVGGGRAPYYDSSLVARITRASWLKVGETIIGERHRVVISKTKIGHKDAKASECFFNTSNGQHIPPGFDRVRDLLELALTVGTVKKVKTRLMDQETGEDYGTINEAVKLMSPESVEFQELWARTIELAEPVDAKEENFE